MKNLILLLFVSILLMPISVHAENWVKVVQNSDGGIYIDTQSLQYVDEDVVRVATKSFDATGYTIVLERYSLQYNSMQMDAILTYTNDGSLIDWNIIDNKKSFMSYIWGESFGRINPDADGMKILAYLKDCDQKGLIPGFKDVNL